MTPSQYFTMLNKKYQHIERLPQSRFGNNSDYYEAYTDPINHKLLRQDMPFFLETKKKKVA